MPGDSCRSSGSASQATAQQALRLHRSAERLLVRCAVADRRGHSAQSKTEDSGWREPPQFATQGP